MAISFDAVTEGTAASASSFSISHTMSASAGGVLFVGIRLGTGGTSITSVTYNGVSMTQVQTTLSIAGPDYALFALNSPATGANNVAINLGSSSALTYIFWSYTGANGGVKNSTTGSADPATSLTVSLTPNEDNCWVVAFFGTPGQTTATAGSGTTKRNTTGLQALAVDNNANINPAASTSLIVNGSSNGYGAIMCAIARDGGTAYSETYTETVTVVDTVNKSTIRTLTDVVTGVDTINKSTSRTVSETVTVVDTFSYVFAYVRELLETIIVTDTITRSIERTLSEVVTAVDSIVRSIGKTLSEVVTAVDSILANVVIGRTFEESVTVTDNVQNERNGWPAIWTPVTKDPSSWTEDTPSGESGHWS